MIELKVLRFRNFLSYGNVWTEYHFKKGISRVSGINGGGKSSLVCALNYAFFGKPFRKTTLPNLVNVINKKNLEVELEFTTKGNHYKIQRGIKPNAFNIFCNGNLLNQDSHKKDYQRYLETDVFKFNESIFHQIGVKSLTRYESFLTLPKNQKRHIIEELFELTVISEMFELNKAEKSTLEQEYKDCVKDRIHKKELVDTELKNIEQLKVIKESLERENQENKTQIENDIKELETNIIDFKDGIAFIDKKVEVKSELVEEKKKLKKSLDTLKDNRLKCITTNTLFEEKIGWLKSKCPTCLRVDEIEDEEGGNQKKNDVDKIDKDIKLLKEKIEEVENQIERINNIEVKKSLLQQKINTNKNQIKRLNEQLNKTIQVVEIDRSKYIRLLEDLKLIDSKIKSIGEDIEHLQVVYGLLQDDGIKSHIIKKYLPLLNKLLNTYLQKFGLDLELEFTHNLDVIIKNSFKDNLTYDNFSSGEKKRVDASVMFCFLEFCKLKYSNAKLNVLMFDEFTVGLDPEGESTFYEILKYMSNKEKLEVITVSHSSLIDPDKIDTVYTASMNRGFSDLKKIEDK